MTVLSKFLDNISSIFDYLLANKRNIFFTSIGLILSFSILFNVFFLQNSINRYVLYDSTENQFFNYSLDGSFHNVTNHSPEFFLESTERFLTKSNLYNIHSSDYLYSTENRFTLFFNNSAIDSVSIIELSNFSTIMHYFNMTFFDFSTNGTVNFFLLSLGTNPQLFNTSNDLGKTFSLRDNYPFNSTHVSGKILGALNENSSRNVLNSSQLSNLNGNFLLTNNLTLFSQTFTKTISSSISSVFYDYTNTLIINLNCSLNIKDYPTIESFAGRLTTLDNELDNSLIHQGITSVTVYNGILLILNENIDATNSALLLIVGSAIPIIFLIIIVNNYAFNLYEVKRKEILQKFFKKGLSFKQFILFSLAESFFIFLISLVCSFPISYLITYVIIKFGGNSFFLSEGLLNYIFYNVFFQTALLGFIFVVITYFPNFIKSFFLISKVSEESEHIENKQDPFWKRNNLDILFLIISMIFGIWYSFRFEISQILKIPYSLINFVVLPVSLFLLIGLLLFSTRILTYFIKISSNFFWKRQKNIFSYSLIQLKLSQKNITRGFLLFSLLFTLIIVCLALPASYSNYIQDSTNYNIGSDYRVDLETNSFNHSELNQLSSILNTFKNLDYTIFSQGSLLGNPVMIINSSTFLNGAYFKESFSKSSNINNLNTNNYSILIDQRNFASYHYNINKNISYPVSSFIKNVLQQDNLINFALNFEIVGTFSLWPNFLTYLSTNPKDTFYTVMSFSTYFQILRILNTLSLSAPSKSIILQPPQISLYFKGEDNKTISKIISSLTNHNFIIKDFLNSNSIITNKLHSVEFITFLIQTNDDLVISFIALLIVISIFVINSILQKSKQIAIDRSIGLSFNQLIKINVYNFIVLLISSSINGIIIGYFILHTLRIYITLSPIPPYPNIIFPFIQIFIIELGFSSIFFIFGLVLIIVFSKVDIPKLLSIE